MNRMNNEDRKKQLMQAASGELRKIMAVDRFSEKGFNSVWFASDEHRRNFITLLDKYKAERNPEYASACYVSAHPEIYHRIKWNEPRENDSPMSWYLGKWIGKDDDDPAGYHEESEIVGRLSSAYSLVARAGAELFFGRQINFDLMHLIGNAGDEVYRLFIQMLEIRRDRFLIDLWHDHDD